jgi:phosphoribosylanthranilate isomerase
MVKVKICGITNLEDAMSAIAGGADAIGFVFYPKSPRYVRPEDASRIIGKLSKKAMRVKRIGVFVNARPARIKRCAALCKLDMVQLHGNESPLVCGRCQPLPVIKAFRVAGPVDTLKLSSYKTFAYLFDTYAAETKGGTGTVFDWKSLGGIRGRRGLRVPGGIFLSGGLNSRNVGKAIRMVQPEWVDVSSSLESRPGRKDRRKIAAFINAAKNAR